GRQWVLIGLRRQQFVKPGKTLVSPGVLRSQNDFPSAARSDFATGQDVESNVYAHRAGMEKVQRPDVECPSGQIGAAWRCGNNLVAIHRGHGLRHGFHKSDCGENRFEGIRPQPRRLTTVAIRRDSYCSAASDSGSRMVYPV